jgi:hypothetical protein
MGLKLMTEAELATVTKPLKINGESATLVDMTGP